MEQSVLVYILGHFNNFRSKKKEFEQYFPFCLFPCLCEQMKSGGWPSVGRLPNGSRQTTAFCEVATHTFGVNGWGGIQSIDQFSFEFEEEPKYI